MDAETIVEIAHAAWEATRSEYAVPFTELEETYRGKLIDRAHAVLGGAEPAEPWVAFETQVGQLGNGQVEIPDEVKEELVEEVVHEVKPKRVPKKVPTKKAPTKRPVKVVKKPEPKPVAKKK